MTRSLATAVVVLVTTFTVAQQAPTIPMSSPGKAPVRTVLVPKVIVAETEPYATTSGTRYTIYKLAVTNLAAFPEELFRPEPGLPPNPCRGKEPVRLLWRISDGNGDTASCGAVKGRKNFRAVVRLPEGETAEVRLVLSDSKSGADYRSKPIRLGK